MDQPVEPEAYTAITTSGYGEFAVYVRTAGNAGAMKKTLENAILSMDRNVVPDGTDTLAAQLEQFAFAKPRFGLELFAVFAAIGFTLVCVGVYSVVSYTVSQQQKEIGIRMALGASSADVRGLVIRSGMRFIVLGIVIGVAVSIGLLRVMRNQISGITTYDPITLAAVVLILKIAGCAACYIPSLRATRVDPLISLRYD